MIITLKFPWGRVRSSRILEQYTDRAGLDVTPYGLVDSREIHVIGQNRLADQMRADLRAGRIPARRLRELPADQTPVHAL
jgi:hypothetical protein